MGSYLLKESFFFFSFSIFPHLGHSRLSTLQQRAFRWLLIPRKQNNGKPGKRWRSELMWRRPPFWRIQPAHGIKRGLAGDRRELTQVQPLLPVRPVKKLKMEATFEVNLRQPFLEDRGRSRLEKGSSTWKKKGGLSWCGPGPPQLQHHNYNSTTLQLQLQLQYITLHPAVVGEVTTATIATTPANTTPTTFRSISGFALPSVIHNNQRLL